MSLKKLIGYGRFAIAFGTALFLIQPPSLAQSVKLTAEQMIEQTFRSDTPLPGSTIKSHQNLMKQKSLAIQWLGRYQEVRRENNVSIIVFERGTIPIEISFTKDGKQASAAAYCPTTTVPLSQAPREVQETFGPMCPKLKR